MQGHRGSQQGEEDQGQDADQLAQSSLPSASSSSHTSNNNLYPPTSPSQLEAGPSSSQPTPSLSSSPSSPTSTNAAGTSRSLVFPSWTNVVGRSLIPRLAPPPSSSNPGQAQVPRRSRAHHPSLLGETSAHHIPQAGRVRKESVVGGGGNDQVPGSATTPPVEWDEVDLEFDVDVELGRTARSNSLAGSGSGGGGGVPRGGRPLKSFQLRRTSTSSSGQGSSSAMGRIPRESTTSKGKAMASSSPPSGQAQGEDVPMQTLGQAGARRLEQGRLEEEIGDEGEEEHRPSSDAGTHDLSPTMVHQGEEDSLVQRSHDLSEVRNADSSHLIAGSKNSRSQLELDSEDEDEGEIEIDRNDPTSSAWLHPPRIDRSYLTINDGQKARLDFEPLTRNEKWVYAVTAVLVLLLSLLGMAIGGDWIDWPGDGIGKS